MYIILYELLNPLRDENLHVLNQPVHLLHEDRHGKVQIIYTNRFGKICVTQASLSIFSVNRRKISKIYTKISQNTQILHELGLQDRALFHLCPLPPSLQKNPFTIYC